MLLFIADEKGGYHSPAAPFFSKSVGSQPGAIAVGTFGPGGFPGVAIANYRSEYGGRLCGAMARAT